MSAVQSKNGFWWWAKENGAGLFFLLLGCGTVSYHGFNVYGADRWLREAEGTVVTVTPDRIDPANEGRLVHVVAPLTRTPDTHTDPWTGTTARAFALVRVLQTYDDAAGRGENTSAGWRNHGMHVVGEPLPKGREPDVWLWLPKVVRAGKFSLAPEMIAPHFPRGAVHLTDGLLERIGTALPKMPRETSALPPTGWEPGSDGWFYMPPRGSRPRADDRRVAYFRADLPEGPITMIGRQRGDRLEPAEWKGGRFAFVGVGEKEIRAAFIEARQENATSFPLVAIIGSAFAGVGLLIIVCANLDAYAARSRGEGLAKDQTPPPSAPPAPQA